MSANLSQELVIYYTTPARWYDIELKFDMLTLQLHEIVWDVVGICKSGNFVAKSFNRRLLSFLITSYW